MPLCTRVGFTGGIVGALGLPEPVARVPDPEAGLAAARIEPATRPDARPAEPETRGTEISLAVGHGPEQHCSVPQEPKDPKPDDSADMNPPPSLPTLPTPNSDLIRLLTERTHVLPIPPDDEDD